MPDTAQNDRPLLEVKGLKKYFPVRGALGTTVQEVKAVNDVTFTLKRGETFGMVGESGCGKSTLGRTILRLTEPTEGQAIYDGRDVFDMTDAQLKAARQDMQMVFQDPFSSLNPRKRIGAILEEPLVIHGIGTAQERTEKVLDILTRVGLQAEHYYRYPHEFSGGQRQRIGIARALMVDPRLIVCDEPVSALDVSIHSQIINLLKQLQAEFGLTYLFIAHDISIVRYISDRIGVMYLGQMVEQAATDDLFAAPKHTHTQALLSAVPVTQPGARKERVVLGGEIPSPLDPPSGCVFHTRCPMATELCKQKAPARREITEGHHVACHLY
ncbi:ABC transporter ATP-binding protein [Tropicibacter naphthalenivorans]|uniref:Stage 0 sporulation protein KE n=1 Tax=Tropicibacter naphthalenivorans TaxID=441103 RepID=A0A0P1GK07_9RHOB|nr:dipeptide ABC transporter ATP-binding protein [Tropicibacter naphthalenivorans]CUH82222.1 Stage 0 sporulation protein KE [Tropicibacter naphthalenivorans]SMD04893.1 oligopeptide transport system ATP-binding protein [Tropicibacter naphthalenivorans]